MAEDDAYWQESQTTQEAKAFNFEDDEAESQLCGVSQSGTARLSQQVRAGIASTSFDDSPAGSKQLIGYGIPKEPKIPITALLPESTINKIISSDNCHILSAKDSSERPPIHTVITKLVLGHPVSLEPFRSLDDKKQLLDAALQIGDGNAVLKVVMFLESTLKKSLWQRLLLEKPEALDLYASYLETRYRHQELSDLLEMAGKSKEAAKKQIKFAMCPGNPQRQVTRLRQCLKNHLNDDDDDRDHVEQWCSLLEWQLSLASLDENIPGSSVADSVARGSRLYRAGMEPSKTEPTAFAQRFHLSSMQTEWTLVEEWAKAQAWDDIETLLFKKSWLGRRKLQTFHSPVKLIHLLHKYNAPPTVIDIYLQQIDSLEERGALAKRLGCHKSLIDVLAVQKDRLALISLQASLEPTEDAHQYAEKTLNTPNFKWKN